MGTIDLFIISEPIYFVKMTRFTFLWSILFQILQKWSFITILLDIIQILLKNNSPASKLSSPFDINIELLKVSPQQIIM